METMKLAIKIRDIADSSNCVGGHWHPSTITLPLQGYPRLLLVMADVI